MLKTIKKRALTFTALIPLLTSLGAIPLTAMATTEVQPPAPATNQATQTTANAESWDWWWHGNWAPRVTGEGQTGNRTIGTFDTLFPVVGNKTNLLFADGRAMYEDSSIYQMTLGGGFRHMFDQTWLGSFYLLNDWTNTRHDNWFNQVNLGAELLGTRWDIRGNGYIPYGNEEKMFGDISTVTEHRGNNIYIAKLSDCEKILAGFDIEVGGIIPLPKTKELRLYLGYFRFGFNEDPTLEGPMARLEWYIKRYLVLTFRDNYDSKRHNQAMAGIRLNFGGPKVTTGTIADRMEDYIVRESSSVIITKTKEIGGYYAEVDETANAGGTDEATELNNVTETSDTGETGNTDGTGGTGVTGSNDGTGGTDGTGSNDGTGGSGGTGSNDGTGGSGGTGSNDGTGGSGVTLPVV